MPVLSRKPGGGGSSGGGAPSGPASGDLTGTYPGPTISTSVISAFGRTLVDDASASAARTTLGMGVAWAGYALIREEQAAGVSGGTFTSGAWRTRVLNTESFDVGSIVSIAANQFSLAAGTYYISARAPAGGVDSHQARIQNVTDATTALVGSLMYTQSTTTYVMTDSIVQGRIVIAGSKAFELQHQCITSLASEGFGSGRDWGDGTVGVYSEVMIYREA